MAANSAILANNMLLRNGDGYRINLSTSYNPSSNAHSLVFSPSADQDPIFDHANGTQTSVTAAALILTPPAGCKYARISTDVTCFIRTDGVDPADAAGSVRILADQPEIIPVVPGVAVKAFAATTAVVRAIPMKSRT